VDKQLTTFASENATELHYGAFLVPQDWKSCGVVVHVAGGAGVGDGQAIALAVNKNSVTLCDTGGPVVSIPLGSIREVKVADLTGMAIPIHTPSGVVDMVPARAKGISVKYELNPMGTQIELSLYTFSPKSAFEWVNVILEAIQRKSTDLGKAGNISRR